MLSRFGAVVLLAATLGACVAPPGARPIVLPLAPAVTIPELPESVLVKSAGRLLRVPLEEYVVVAALSEITPLGDSPDVAARIYEVQAVVARTYAVAHAGRHRSEGFDFCDTTHCQIYEPGRRQTSRFAAAAERAVQETRAQVLTYGSQFAEALFHADCGGSTASASDVWGGAPVPYLRGMVDDLPAPAHRAWTVTATSDEVRQALNADARTSVGRALKTIDIVARDDSGRAAGIGVRGERSYTVKGDVLRAVINKKLGERAIQSTRFDVDRQGTNFVFEGTGFGHGVGLCQRGAMARVRRGETIREILSLYYPGAHLRRAPGV